MNLNNALQSVAAIVAILAACIAAITWVIKHWIHDQLSELRPNGGGSTYDVIRKVARDVERAAEASEENRAHIEQVLERVSNLEQVVVAWTPKKIAPVKKTVTPRKRA
jgi:HAMP domain-containing protein